MIAGRGCAFHEKATPVKRVSPRSACLHPSDRVAAMLPFALFAGHFRGPVHDEVRPAGAAIYRSTSLRVQGQVAVTRTGRLFTIFQSSCNRLGLGSQRLIFVLRDPQTMEHARKLPRDSDDSSALCVLAAALSERVPPPLQITVLTKRSKHVLSALHQQRSQKRITGFGNPKLLLDLA